MTSTSTSEGPATGYDDGIKQLGFTDLAAMAVGRVDSLLAIAEHAGHQRRQGLALFLMTTSSGLYLVRYCAKSRSAEAVRVLGAEELKEARREQRIDDAYFEMWVTCGLAAVSIGGGILLAEVGGFALVARGVVEGGQCVLSAQRYFGRRADPEAQAWADGNVGTVVDLGLTVGAFGLSLQKTSRTFSKFRSLAPGSDARLLAGLKLYKVHLFDMAIAGTNLIRGVAASRDALLEIMGQHANQPGDAAP